MKGIKSVLSKLIILAITLILISQLFIMTREITWHAILSTVNDIAWWQLLLLVVCGFLVIVPTIFNDVILKEWQDYHLSLRETVQRAWLINVFNINAGFVGILSVFLRRIFYNDQPRKNLLNHLYRCIFWVKVDCYLRVSWLLLYYCYVLRIS
nr:hypothetical protein [Leuconostoc litchii]